jgi:hypothetical protein
MAFELTAQHFRQIHRESGSSAVYAKSMNIAEGLPDAAWRAMVANPGSPRIAASADLPVNTIAGWVAPQEVVVTTDRWKSLLDRAPIARDEGWFALLANSDRPSIDPALDIPANASAGFLERAAPTHLRAGDL